ncbi:FAD-dependent oxidoreductase [Limimaricola hongkongensis]|uniref:Salicylate hydroxylase n=1 Tax=Limimaricola hongkongensis DSM 17492 TaxID=1122180 RepID=A0A017HHW5_9RHOB|nr:FAD-dependent oxidoreductase [Limimaricola hongkongensis]EYD73753.1 Salicylate hydroxylase [Limimaricola hongkongensis DSM 17492]
MTGLPRRIAVAGAGIGGLTAALCLARAGHDVTIYERAPALREIGAGLQITPNGAAVLERMGLGPALDAAAIRAHAVCPTDGRSGRAIARFALDGGSYPYRFMHRAALVDLLAEAAQAAGARIVTGCRVTGADPARGRLDVDAGPPVEAELIVAADGLRSVLRPLIAPGAPAFTGQVAWRAVIDDFQAPPEARIWMLPGRHVVTYPLPGGRLNLVAVREQADWAPEGWDHADDPARLRAVFGDAAPDLRDILGRIEQVRLWGLFRHPVPARWHAGRLALLGDAAHPTLPFLAQGANLAIEDGWVLARMLDAPGGLDAALERYGQARAPRVRRAIAAAQANARNYHLSGPARVVAHAGLGAIGRIAPARFTARMAWLHAHDVTRERPAATGDDGPTS